MQRKITEQIIRIYKNKNDEKAKVITEKRVHTLRAKSFYSILREEEEGYLILSFDCQKNMSLPKLPDSSAYFSSQINFYNFCIVTGSSNAKLTKDNVHCYTWNETKRSKGSNEIASAVYHRLSNVDLNEITKIKLVADGCGGQNKNTNIICMLMKWLSDTQSSVKEIVFVFPVVGHSFIPPDRVFAQIEKCNRKKEVIILPKNYQDTIAEKFTVYKLAETVTKFDWKEESKVYLKLPGAWHFKFNESKRFILKKTKGNVSVRGEVFYRSDTGASKLVTKKDKTTTLIQQYCQLGSNKIRKKLKVLPTCFKNTMAKIGGM